MCRAAVLEIDGIKPHIPQGKVVAGVADIRFQGIEIIVLLRMSEELILVLLEVAADFVRRQICLCLRIAELLPK